MDERESVESTPLVELIEQVLQGTASEGQKRQLQDRLAASAEDRKLYLHHLNLHSALRRQFAFDAEAETPAQLDVVANGPDSKSVPRGPTPRRLRRTWAAVAAVVVVLIAGIYLLHPNPEPQIATVTEINGALQWTGDGGRVVRDLEVGSPLQGGTLESLFADSWAVLTFRDGSTVTVSGQSRLTISEQGHSGDGQKEMHLREGSLSANVAQQPEGRPMLIHTPTAKLEVLGTQLNIDARRASTTLRVNEGQVRVTRLADGNVADVPADHQVVVSASPLADFKVSRRPESVGSWRSNLPSDAGYGDWISEGADADGRLRTAPILLNFQKEPITLYLAGISVARDSGAAVVLPSGGKFRIRGRMEAPTDVYFGLTMKHVKGGFAGKYVATFRVGESSGGDGPNRDGLDIEMHLGEFRPQEKESAESPIGLEIVDWWCFTYNVDAGLSIDSVDLLPSASAEATQPPAAQPPKLPIMDIWTAASQGNLEAVKRHLAAGAEIDATFVAPGIPASGATPLHLAVLSDQRAVAQYLIERRANLDARAKDEHGGTPLHWAAVLGRIEMARRLIEAGADMNAKDNHGFTPLDATNYDRESEGKAKREIAELLREKGAGRN